MNLKSKRLRGLGVAVALGAVGLVLYASRAIRKDAEARVFRNSSAVPHKRVALVLGYAGFSTSDSIIRAKKVFGVKDLCVVSQPDHIMRAIYIARHHGMKAVGFAANDIAFRWSWRTRVRESLARVRTLFDVQVWD